MEKQQDRIRIKDIAQMAGVSVGTVDPCTSLPERCV